MEKSKERSIITDKLVIAKSGKAIEDWFKILDKAGGKKLSHPEIFEIISGIEELKPLGQWNHNLLRTAYEWSRKLKERGQKKDGFEISVSKTISVPVGVLFNSVNDKTFQKKWLKKELNVRKSALNKSLVATGEDEETTIQIELYNKGENKSQAVIQQMKIKDLKSAEQMKEFWSKALADLKLILEK